MLYIAERDMVHDRRHTFREHASHMFTSYLDDLSSLLSALLTACNDDASPVNATATAVDA